MYSASHATPMSDTRRAPIHGGRLFRQARARCLNSTTTSPAMAAFSTCSHIDAGGMAEVAVAVLLTLMMALLGAVVEAGDPPFSCGPSSAEASQGYAFCDATLPAAQRAADLVARMTPAEKVAQLGDQAAGVPRLGVPAYKWWNEALHGLATSGRGLHFDTPGGVRAATSFPQVLLTAAAFDDDLWFRIGQAIGREARALFNLGQAEGLTIWSPNVNIFRDPRWGRGQETPGEDPATASRYAVAFVRGLQGNSSTAGLLQTSACCKHATAYDLEDWNGVARYSFVARVTTQDLEDTFNPPFRSCVVDGKASCVMCAYTAVNGVPSCANADLLTGTIRGDWGLDGYVASDCDAVAIMRDAQRYTPTPEDAVAVSLKAGLDIDCGSYVQQHATGAIQQGKLTEQDVDKALTNLFAVRMRLGHFDGDPRTNMYGALGAADICTPEHKSLALEAAQDGIVLIKNDAGILPLDRSAVASAAAIGPNANDGMSLIGNYFGPPCESTTPLRGLQGYVKDVRFLAACNSAACDVAATDQAVALASSADYVFLFMGLSQQQESEGRDRTSLLLPGMQQSLITAVANAAKRPVILVLLTGGPVDITFAQSNPKIGAILWAGYPGQAGGIAIAKVLFGDHNPSGRLPVTWYPEEFTKVPMTDMRMRADPATGYPGRSYRFYQGKTIYKFGYGLSYSSFSRRLLSGANKPALYTNVLTGLRETLTEEGGASYHVDDIGTDGCEQLKFLAMVEVLNQGPMDGKHSVLLFIRWPNTKSGRPASQLIGFRSQHLKAGEKANLRFEVSPCEHFSRVREDGRKVIDKGSHFLMVDNHEMEIGFEA
ncbi:probable beta-D-xylosidase 7 [Phragmites australis]|uniref:probable beta-D-xylosidase 7 n=1 Tax=Phragmites australis TaxID=29695 RepID=UPI002D787177|nr:probable beta-D-xylosidase 7 [Phragmites australis]